MTVLRITNKLKEVTESIFGYPVVVSTGWKDKKTCCVCLGELQQPSEEERRWVKAVMIDAILTKTPSYPIRKIKDAVDMHYTYCPKCEIYDRVAVYDALGLNLGDYFG